MELRKQLGLRLVAANATWPAVCGRGRSLREQAVDRCVRLRVSKLAAGQGFPEKDNALLAMRLPDVIQQANDDIDDEE